MKRLLLVVTILGVLLGSMESAYAGNSANTRNKCRWWAKRYAVNCHLAKASWSCGVHYSWTHDGDCDWAYRHMEKAWCCGSTSVSHAEAAGWGHYRYLIKYCGTTGGMLNELLTDAGVMTADDGEETISDGASQEESMVPVFRDGVIVLNDIKMSLTLPAGSADENTITTAVWIPKDDSTKGIEDTLYDDSKAIIIGKISLKGGELRVTGDIYSADDFKTERTDAGTTVTYVGGAKTLAISPDIDMDAIAVNGSGDIMGDEKESMAKLAATAQGNASLNLYPNPAADVLQLSLQQADAQTASVAIYDLNGRRVKAAEQLQVKQGTTVLDIDIASLPAGNYYLMVKGENLRIVKQFTKQ